MNLEWAHVIIGVVSAIAGGGFGLVAGVWKVAHIEQDIRKDYAQDIAESAHELGEKVSELASQYDETLKGIRQKINDVELHTEREFVSKLGFDEFRREFREDMKSLNEKLDRITSRQRQ